MMKCRYGDITYEAVIKLDDEAGIFHGEVVNLRDIITFEGTSFNELVDAFRESVESYLEYCKMKGREPDRPFPGNLSLRIPPELHRAVHIAAKCSGMSINAWITEVLEREVTVARKKKFSPASWGRAQGINTVPVARDNLIQDLKDATTMPC